MPGPGMELIGEEEIQAAMEVLEGGYLFRYGVSLGDSVDPRFKGKVFQLEEEVPRRLGSRYGVAVNSGTSALLTASASAVTFWPVLSSWARACATSIRNGRGSI